jgi:hypothetical protein
MLPFLMQDNLYHALTATPGTRVIPQAGIITWHGIYTYTPYNKEQIYPEPGTEFGNRGGAMFPGLQRPVRSFRFFVLILGYRWFFQG